MYAMPRKSFRTTATALLSIPSTHGTRTPRSTSPLPTSMSMMLPATPHTVVPPSSCRSSPGNATDDPNRSIVDFQSLATAPDIRPNTLQPPPPVSIDREDWKQLLNGSKQRYALLRKAIGFLHDNRAQSSKHPNTARRLREINAELRADDSHRVLKLMLNALLIAIGLILLLSVLAAIGYTSSGQYWIDGCAPLTHAANMFMWLRFNEHVRQRCPAGPFMPISASTRPDSFESRQAHHCDHYNEQSELTDMYTGSSKVFTNERMNEFMSRAHETVGL